MKKFLMYCLVLVVILFLGFTTYYFVANKENITLAHDQTESLKLNEGETFGYNDLIIHTQPHKSTTIKIASGDESILSYNKETKIFTAEKAGATTLTIKPSNARFGPFTLNVVVGNGASTETPYFISDSTELMKIGQTGSGWTNSLNYELSADIYLTDLEFTPIAYNSEFNGTFNGAGHTIYDLNISNAYVNNAGMFAEIGKNGVVKNLNMVNATLAGEFVNVGFVAGINKGTICLTSVKDSSINNTRNGAFVGGIVGTNQCNFYNTSIKGANVGMCGVENITFTTKGGATGGIAGKNCASIIEDCFAVIKEVKGTNTNFGGIVGDNIVATSGGIHLGSSLLRNHAIVDTLNNTGISAGIAGSANDSNTAVKNTYTRNYFNIDTNNFVGTSTNYTATQIEKKNSQALAIEATYIDWDFKNTWVMGEKYAVIDFKNVYSSTINQGDIDNEGDDIIQNPGENNQVGTTENEIYEMIADMRANPNAGKAYAVTGNHTINMLVAPWNATSWEPIGTVAKPFNGKLIVNGTLTFANLEIKDKMYAGFFGYVSGATISNVDFVNTKIESSSSKLSSSTAFAGVVAGYAGTGTKIVGCDITSARITAFDKVGGVAGVNYGTIQNCNITSSSQSTISATDSSCMVGGISGLNGGTINICGVNGAKISLGTNANGNVGGIVGQNDGSISSVTTNNIEMKTDSVNVVKFGGIAGQNNKNITSSVVAGAVITASVTAENVNVAGITAVNGTSAKITGAKITASTLTGYNVAGISVDNFGKIERVAVGAEGSGEGKITGYYAGGFVVNNQANAQIKDSMACTVMEGIHTFGNVNGFAYSIKDGSIIENCLTASSFIGKGGFNADTSTAYRNWWSGLLSNLPWNDKMGTIKNSLIVNTSGKYVQGYGLAIDNFSNPILSKYDVVISSEIARGSDNFKTFNKIGFNTNSWNFMSGKLPIPKI